MKIMIAAVFYFLYWGVCFLGTGTDRKNLIGLRSYPDEVQTPHHDINHDANINEEKQSYYQDSLFFFG